MELLSIPSPSGAEERAEGALAEGQHEGPVSVEIDGQQTEIGDGSEIRTPAGGQAEEMAR